MLKYITLLLSIICIFSSCKTPNQLVDKALKKDPNILKNYVRYYDTVIIVKDTINYKDTIPIEGHKSIDFSIPKDKEGKDTIIENKNYIIFEDSKVKLNKIKDSLGNEKYNIEVKPYDFFYQKLIPYQKDVKLEGKTPPTIIIKNKTAWHYFGLICFVLCIILLIIRIFFK